MSLLVNGLLNFLNLALTAYILSQTKKVKRTAGRNRKATQAVAAKVDQVKSQTDGKLSELLSMIEKANDQLAATAQGHVLAPRPRAKKPKRKPGGK